MSEIENISVSFGLTTLPKATQIIMQILRKEPEGIAPNALAQLTRLTPRQIRHVIEKLVKLGLVAKIPNLFDLRSVLYVLPRVMEKPSLAAH